MGKRRDYVHKNAAEGKYSGRSIFGLTDMVRDTLEGPREPAEKQRMAGEAQELKQPPAPQPPAFEPIERYRKIGDFRNFRWDLNNQVDKALL